MQRVDLNGVRGAWCRVLCRVQGAVPSAGCRVLKHALWLLQEAHNCVACETGFAKQLSGGSLLKTEEHQQQVFRSNLIGLNGVASSLRSWRKSQDRGKQE
jgi:hypothetical protein